MAKNTSKPTTGRPTTEIVDFAEARAKKLEEKRQNASRIIFKQMLGIYVVTGDEATRALEIIDVSEEGCSFQVPLNIKDPWPSDLKEIPIRMYFSQDTYLPLNLKIQNSRPYLEEGVRYTRVGCVIDNTFSSYEVYKNFVRFLKSYAEQAHKDLGDNTLFYI